jgi:hypothetical protein
MQTKNSVERDDDGYGAEEMIFDERWEVTTIATTRNVVTDRRNATVQTKRERHDGDVG